MHFDDRTPDIDQQGAVKELDKNTRAALDNISNEKRNTINDCLWSSIKEWIVIPFFCPLEHDRIMETNYYKWLTSARYFCHEVIFKV